MPGRTVSATLLAICCAGGCSIERMALDQTASILKRSQRAFEREWDYELAARSLPTNVKLIEGFLETGPDNEDLLELAAKAYTSLSLVVLEDQLEQIDADEQEQKADRVRKRATEMYLRGFRYGLRWLDVRQDRFSEAFRKGRDALSQALARCDVDDADALVWTALPLFSAINLRRDDVAVIALLPKAKALITRAAELNERVFNAAPHLVLGGLLGGVSKMYGGDPDKSRRHFERALALTKHRFLLIHVMYAQTLAVQLADRKLFTSLLQEVVKAPMSLYPEQKLANVVAKRKARRLLLRADELF